MSPKEDHMNYANDTRQSSTLYTVQMKNIQHVLLFVWYYILLHLKHDPSDIKQVWDWESEESNSLDLKVT